MIMVKFLWPDQNIKAEPSVSLFFVEIYLLAKNEKYHATLFRGIDITFGRPRVSYSICKNKIFQI